MVKVTRNLLLVANVAKKIAEQLVADATWAILLIEILHSGNPGFLTGTELQVPLLSLRTTTLVNFLIHILK